MISKEPCGDHPHTGPPAQAGGPGPASVPAAAGAARHDRPDRRIAVHPGAHLRGRVRHPPAALRVPRRAGHRARRRRQHGLLRGPVRHRDLTGRGHPFLRGKITGAGTFLGGILHTLPFLIPAYRAALAAALATIVFELAALAWIRWRFFATGFLRSFISIAIGGAIIASVSAALGAVS